MCHFRVHNDPFVLKKFFWNKPFLLLLSTYWSFSLCKILKKFLIWIQRMRHFLGSKWSICPKQFFFFFWKIIVINLIYLLAPFIVKNFKNILTADPELWGCTIFWPKMAHLPKSEFFQKVCQCALFLSFVPVYMPKIKVRY